MESSARHILNSQFSAINKHFMRSYEKTESFFVFNRFLIVPVPSMFLSFSVNPVSFRREAGISKS